LMGVWVEAAQANSLGLTPIQFVRYFIAVFLARQFSIVWVIWDFEREIVEGKLSLRLLQPLDPVWHYVATHISERFARLPFAVVVMVLFFVVYPAALWWPGVGAIATFAMIVMLSFTLRFAMQYTMAMFAFWTERANALEQFSFLFYLFLSGLIAPLEVFPPGVRAIIEWTPFPYMINFPASVLVGLPVDLPRSLAIMLGWIGLFVVINRVLWRKGLRQYSGMGA
jgi:ABC-2 type transport system permease protein